MRSGSKAWQCLLNKFLGTEGSPERMVTNFHRIGVHNIDKAPSVSLKYLNKHVNATQEAACLYVVYMRCSGVKSRKYPSMKTAAGMYKETTKMMEFYLQMVITAREVCGVVMHVIVQEKASDTEIQYLNLRIDVLYLCRCRGSVPFNSKIEY